MNKKEKLYFIEKLFTNHINYRENFSKEYDFNFDIVHMFYYLDMIPRTVFEEVRDLVKECAYEDSYLSLVEAQNLLCDELGIKVEY